MSTKITLDSECPDCGGTGLYSGFAEPEGTAVICHSCKGTGCKKISYVLFTGRKRKDGIKKVLLDGGLWMMRSKDNPPKSISAEEFYDNRK